MFIAEDLAHELTATGVDLWGTARFSGYIDGSEESFSDLALDEALAWGRQRAEVVVLRVIGYGEPFSVGSLPASGYRPWPPAASAAVVRRRAPGEECKDRTDQDPPIMWRADVALSPALLPQRDHRTDHERVVS